MPQIWMTYDELARLCDCSVADARAHAIHVALHRRKSRDGRTRVKLNLDLTTAFIARIREADIDIDLAVEQLRQTHRQMAHASAGDAAHDASRGTRSA